MWNKGENIFVFKTGKLDKSDEIHSSLQGDFSDRAESTLPPQ
jgi:hypothetical protein